MENISKLRNGLSITEFAKKLGVSRPTVAGWMKDGLPYARLGEKIVRIDFQDATKWLGELSSKQKEG
jgi:excisionase family DNA binding protein